jgi:hypothetical protein
MDGTLSSESQHSSATALPRIRVSKAQREKIFDYSKKKYLGNFAQGNSPHI